MTNSNVPRVSVCIPTINRPHLLREALASVAAQTWSDYEVVVADNSGAPEQQRAIDAVLAEFSALRPKLVRHDVSLDVASNFNSMIDASGGELWVCLPDDDRLRPTFLARSIAALDRHPECSFTFADHWVIRADGTVDEASSARASVTFNRASLREGVYRHDSLFEVVLKQATCLQAALLRRSVMTSFRFLPDILALDLSLFLRLSTSSQPIQGYYIDERLMEYRIHSEQISSTTRRGDFIRAQIAAMESAGRVPPSHARRFNAKLSRQYLALALMEAESGERAGARAHAKRSFRLSASVPTTLGAALAVLAPGAVPYIRRLVARIRA